MAGSHVFVVVVLVGLLGVLHLIQWAVLRAGGRAQTGPPAGRPARTLGRGPWGRALAVGAVLAVSFAAAAPFVRRLLT